MTLNQLIDKISALGNAHEMIETVWNGPIMDRLALGDVTYPLMTFDVNTARIVGSDASYDFQMVFIDRLVIDSENEREVQSDQMSILQDIIAQLRWPGGIGRSMARSRCRSSRTRRRIFWPGWPRRSRLHCHINPIAAKYRRN